MKVGSLEETRVLTWVADQARKHLGAKRIILFGSRARGDAHDRSDFDLAIEAEFPEKFTEFRAVLEENPYTLLAFDVVDLNTVTQEFRERIEKEGRELT